MAKMLSEKQIHKIGRINQVIRDYFEANPDLIEIPAKELMSIFIQKGFFINFLFFLFCFFNL